MAKAIMVQGTMSGAGKSLLCTALCRIFKEDGYRVAPFKAQNMALNSYITDEGYEIGRAQAVQAFAAGVSPDVRMNPVLLKPTGDTGSQIVVNGVAKSTMKAQDYYKYKKELIPDVVRAYKELSEEYDIIVIEGAGSPAEINLREDDFVNMGMAKIADCPVILCGDIDRGGVFAQLYGTKELLTAEEQKRIAGFVINKFRGDIEILKPGIAELEKLCGIKVLGTVPYIDVDIEEEDSMAAKLSYNKTNPECIIDIAVVRLPRISNFTDFQALEMEADVNVRYVVRPAELDSADVVILPGSKSTMEDLKWLRETGLFERILRCHRKGKIIIGICGGMQMLGERIFDKCGAESTGMSEMTGLSLLKMDTVFEKNKLQTQKELVLSEYEGFWRKLTGTSVKGYEVHAGKTDSAVYDADEGILIADRVLGTYIHGVFDSPDFREAFIETAALDKGIYRKATRSISYDEYRKEQLDILAKAVRGSLDIERIYGYISGNEGVGDSETADNYVKEYVKPDEIEKRSMELIEKELGVRRLWFDDEELQIVKRVIHTSADFEYAQNIVFSERCITIFRETLVNGCTVVTDTRMAFSGINKNRLLNAGSEAMCFIDDEQVASEASKLGMTRSAVAVRHAARLTGNVIYVVGNAPTALIELYELINKGEADNIKGIIAVPVGFVNVVEAKELIMKLKLPYIVAKGRKGGSNVAAAIVNALVYGI